MKIKDIEPGQTFTDGVHVFKKCKVWSGWRWLGVRGWSYKAFRFDGRRTDFQLVPSPELEPVVAAIGQVLAGC